MTDDVLISVEGGVGRIRLNRPKAIHALTTRMCEAMSDALLKWRSDDAVEAVIIDHAEGRGFCAGGDVVMLWRSGSGDAEDAKHFFFAEYRLNHLLFTYPKPTVAIMDGITMGGGVGISMPCKYRIATEATRFAAMAKRLATDTGSSVVDRALQLHGGYGYLMDYPIERFWRDLRVHSILEGTNQVMRVIVSRDMLRQ